MQERESVNPANHWTWLEVINGGIKLKGHRWIFTRDRNMKFEMRIESTYRQAEIFEIRDVIRLLDTDKVKAKCVGSEASMLISIIEDLKEKLHTYEGSAIKWGNMLKTEVNLQANRIEVYKKEIEKAKTRLRLYKYITITLIAMIVWGIVNFLKH